LGIVKILISGCRALKSITIPSSIETIPKSWFDSCTSLEAVTFSGGSQLVRIEERAFMSCSSLQSLCLPPLVEFIIKSRFRRCWSMSSLIVASPCRVRELLGLPPIWPGFNEISDSVEILGLWQADEVAVWPGGDQLSSLVSSGHR
jgi:hypothetical protein